MTRALLLAVVAPLFLTGVAHAQTVRPLPPGPSAWEQNRWQGEQHRYEMDRLRLQTEQRQAATRQLQLETRLNRMDLDSRRTTDPYIPSAPPALRSPEEKRGARVAATERRRATTDSVTQIDSWLDRRPN